MSQIKIGSIAGPVALVLVVIAAGWWGSDTPAQSSETGARISRSILYLAEVMHEVPAIVIVCCDVAAALERYQTLIPEPGPLGLKPNRAWVPPEKQR